MKSDLFMFKLYFGWTQKRRQTEKLRWHIVLLQQQKLRQPQKWKSEDYLKIRSPQKANDLKMNE